jgi:hypothetical protein
MGSPVVTVTQGQVPVVTWVSSEPVSWDEEEPGQEKEIGTHHP